MSNANIDDFVNYELEYRKCIKKAKVAGNSLTGLCPFHADKNNSFSVDLKTGKWHCFTEETGGNFIDFYAQINGMTTKDAYHEILKQHGMEKEEKQDRNFTLEQYSEQKHLPVEWLKAYCLLETGKDRGKDGVSFVKFPYFNTKSERTVVRKRYANKEFRWSSGARGKINLYGEWRMDAQDSYIVLVEGESDAQSLWFMGIPALGVPGASMFKPSHVEVLKETPKIFIHKENDRGGETFLSKVTNGLKRGGYEGEVFVFSCGSIKGCKDPSDVLAKYSNEGGKGAREKAGQIIADLLGKAGKKDIDVKEEIPEQIPGAPVNLRVPENWNYDETGIYYTDSRNYSETRICGTPILITRRVKHISSGDEKIEIAFLKTEATGRKWRKAILPRSTLFTTNGTKVLADLGAMVTSENIKQVIKFLSALEMANDDVIGWAEATSSFGWQDRGRFVPGMGGDLILDLENTKGTVAAAYRTHGTYDAWKRTMQEHRDKNRFRFMLAAAFATPMLKILNQRTFFVYNWGDARGGKTAALKAALSVWGEPDGLMMNFNATQVGLEHMAALFSDLPLGIDERQAAGTGEYGQKKIENIVYMIGEGKGKTRGAKDGGIQKVQKWRTIALATGEEPMTTGTSQTGVSTRVIELYQGPFKDEIEAGKMHADSASNYGFAGPEFIKCLIGVPEETLKKLFSKMSEYVRKVGGGKAGSHVSGVSVVALADALADTWIFGEDSGGNTVSEKSWARACAMAKDIMNEQLSASSGDVNENATKFLVDWIFSNQSSFTDGYIGKRLGVIEDDGKKAYIVASEMTMALKEAGYNERKTREYLASNGLITSCTRNGKKEYTVIKKFDGSSRRFVEFFIDKANGIEDGQSKIDEWVDVKDGDELPF